MNAGNNKVRKKAGGKRKTARKKTGHRGDRNRDQAAAEPAAATGDRGEARPLDFPVVGIGASAGGLEAVAALLAHLPPDTGMAFVLVQHLAPEHESLMSELLQRDTSIQVSEIRDGVSVEPDHLYVIPPNSTLGILNGALYLMPRDHGSKHFVIDAFFESLARDQKNKAIGVILSGSASDGTLGLKAIKAADGLTFVQDPDSAGNDGMPRSAIASGCADWILTPQELGRELGRIGHRRIMLDTEFTADEGAGGTDAEMKKLLMLVRNRTGHDFSDYKQRSVRRRIARRMLVHRIDDVGTYVRYLNDRPGEIDALFQELLINVTAFFREPEAYEVLKRRVFPELVDSCGPEGIRIWVIGCSSGEEVYSLLIALLEYLEETDAGNTPIQAFGTDIDDEALKQARAGVYPESIEAEVSAQRLSRFFQHTAQGFQINKRIRDMCVFAPQDVIRDPPFSHIDLVSCRNLLIYLRQATQRRLLHLVHYALKPHGYLFLGTSETVGASADLFASVDLEQKVFRKKAVASRVPSAPTSFRSPGPGAPAARGAMIKRDAPTSGPDDLEQTAESIIINRFGPPGAVIGKDMEVLHFIGHTWPYLTPPPGAASLNLLRLAHPDLAVTLRALVQEAMESDESASRKGVHMQHAGESRELEITVLPLPPRQAPDSHWLVLFQPGAVHETAMPVAATSGEEADTGDARQARRIAELEQQLQDTKRDMQRIIREHEASNEELQSANEEIQSTNEELQSTNEELETTKEELQSTNEELITVNEELESRNAELSRRNDDLSNLFTSAELPIVMLKQDLTIRYFSPQASELLNLIDSDLERPVGDLRTNLVDVDISGKAQQVLKTLEPVMADVFDNQGHCHSMRIRPYRTHDNRITGVVVLFVDMTETRKLLERARRLATVIEDSNDAIIVQDFDGRIQAWNRRAAEIYGYSEAEALRSGIEAIVPEDGVDGWRAQVNAALDGENMLPFESQRLTRDGERVRVLVTMTLLTGEGGEPVAIATTERLLGPLDEQDQRP